MKIRFKDSTEATINDASSIYCLVLDSVDSSAISAFSSRLTNDNLSSFQLLEDDGTVVTSMENFAAVRTQSLGDRTAFILRHLTETEKSRHVHANQGILNKISSVLFNRLEGGGGYWIQSQWKKLPCTEGFN